MSAIKQLTGCDKLNLMLRRIQLTARLSNSLNRTQGRFDTTTVFWFPLTFEKYLESQKLKNKTLYRYNPAIKNYTSYIEYDEYGGPVKRVDITGKPHMGIATPHVLEYSSKRTGSILSYSTPKKNKVRPAQEWELPEIS